MKINTQMNKQLFNIMGSTGGMYIPLSRMRVLSLTCVMNMVQALLSSLLI